jgi:hypothetical protein
MGTPGEYPNVLCRGDEYRLLVTDCGQPIHGTANVGDIEGFNKHVAWYGGPSKSRRDGWRLDFTRGDPSAADLEHDIGFFPKLSISY